MSLNKTSVLALGFGNIKDVSTTNRIFASKNQVTTWNPVILYSANDCVEYLGAIYRSNQSQTNHTPATSSIYWDVVFTYVSDGDICVSSSPIAATAQRTNGIWMSLSYSPVVKSLVDGQVSLAEIFRYSGADFKHAKIDYEVSRPNGNTRAGTFTVLSNGTSEFSFNEEFTVLADEVGVDLNLSIDSGQIVFSYTSATQSTPITFKYLLKGW